MAAAMNHVQQVPYSKTLPSNKTHNGDYVVQGPDVGIGLIKRFEYVGMVTVISGCLGSISDSCMIGYVDKLVGHLI